MEEHNKTLQAVLQRAMDFGITFNPDKCQFGVEEIEFYGHNFTKDGLKPNPDKIRAVKPFKVHPKIRITNHTIAKADPQRYKVQMGSRRE